MQAAPLTRKIMKKNRAGNPVYNILRGVLASNEITELQTSYRVNCNTNYAPEKLQKTRLITKHTLGYSSIHQITSYELNG